MAKIFLKKASPPVAQAIHYLNQLNFDYIIRLMTSKKYYLPTWTKEEALFCRTLYKRFLTLHIKYPNQPLVPTKEIDEFWHNHILHTKKYHQDCVAMFGHYRHHTPSSHSDSEITMLKNGFDKTKEFYFLEFKEHL